MYIKLTNGVPENYTIGRLRKDNPNVSFPKVIPEATLAEYGVYPVVDSSVPTAGDLQVINQDGYIQDAQGNWTQNYVVADRYKDVLDDNGNVVKTKAEFEAEHLAALDEQAASDVRNKRNQLLEETDFYALTDVNMPIEIVNYRQALRDITEHVNFPYLNETDWPVKP